MSLILLLFMIIVVEKGPQEKAFPIHDAFEAERHAFELVVFQHVQALPLFIFAVSEENALSLN